MLGKKLKAWSCVIISIFCFIVSGMFIDAKYLYNVDIPIHQLVVTVLVGIASMVSFINLFQSIAVKKHKNKIDGGG